MKASTRQDWKGRASQEDITRRSVFQYLEPKTEPEFLDEPSDADAAWMFHTDRLWLLRDQAWHAQNLLPPDEAQRPELALRWLRFLLRDSARSTFLTGTVAKSDVRFYRDGRPAPRCEWDSTALPGQQPWSNVLTWLRGSHCSSRLNVVELEVALVLFNWTAAEPQFAPWVYESPDVLRAIDQFLLRRYCFPLVWAIKKARKVPYFSEGGQFSLTRSRALLGPKDFTEPAYRAGEHVAWIRMTGLVVVGLLALLGMDWLQATCFAGPWWSVLLLAVGSVCGIRLLCRIDVLKQNLGQLTRSQASLRTRSVFRRLVGIGLLAGIALTMFRAFQTLPAWSPDRLWRPDPPGNPLTNLVLPQWGSFRHGWGWFWLLAGAVTQGLIAAFVGVVLQWFWEDKAATEPI